MLVILALGALAAPPDGVVLDRVEVWDAGARAALDGPPGCWEVVGRATWDYDAGRFGSSRGDSVFVGRLVDGVWVDVRIAPLGELTQTRAQEASLIFSTEPRFVPLLGQIGPSSFYDPGGDEPDDDADRGSKRRGSKEEEPEGPENVIEQVFAELEGGAETVWASWREATRSVEVVRVVPLGRGAQAPVAEVRVRFPEGGTEPDRVDISFPPRFMVGDGPVRARVEGARVEATVRPLADGASFPAAEAYSFTASVLGLQFTGAQSVKYTNAVRCSS